jgi:hypothetical protein
MFGTYSLEHDFTGSELPSGVMDWRLRGVCEKKDDGPVLVQYVMGDVRKNTVAPLNPKSVKVYAG